jgi:hypothetical protein
MLGLLKTLKGDGLTLESLTPLLKQIGMELEMRPVDQAKEEAFTSLAHKALTCGASVLQMQGRMKNGDGIHALLVVAQDEQKKLTGG